MALADITWGSTRPLKPLRKIRNFDMMFDANVSNGDLHYTELLPEANERVDLAASGMSLSLSNIPRPSRPASTMTHRRMQWRIELRMRAAAGESIARYDQP